MLTRLSRFAFNNRERLKAALPVRGPLLLRLPEFKLYVRLDDWAVGARIAVRRSYEAHVGAAMWPYLRPGATVVDVGANIGYYSMLAAARVGPAGRVLAFEPNHTNCALLQASAAANGFATVTLYPYAASDRQELLEFCVDDSNGILRTAGHTSFSYQVPAVALDRFLAHEPHIDLVKLDIEGAEGRAILGMQATLRRQKPVIFSELSPNALTAVSGMTPAEYLDLLRSLGYALFLIDRTNGVGAEPQSNAVILAALDAPGQLDHVDLLARPS